VNKQEFCTDTKTVPLFSITDYFVCFVPGNPQVEAGHVLSFAHDVYFLQTIGVVVNGLKCGRLVFCVQSVGCYP